MKMRVIVLAGAIMLLAAGAQAPAAKESQRDLGALGEAMLKSGDVEGAVAAFRAAYASGPTKQSRATLARALLASSEFAQAASLAGDDLEMAPLRIEALLRQHFYDAVIAWAQNANDLGGLRRLSLARARFGLGDEAGARAELAAALRESGADARPLWLFRAEMDLYANKLDDADAALRRAREAGASATDADRLAIELQIRAGAFDQAQKAISAAVPARRAPIDPRVTLLRAKLLAARGDYVQATRFYRDARRYAESTPYGSLEIGLAFDAAGDGAQADAAFRAARDQAPLNAPAAESLLSFLQRREPRGAAADEGAAVPKAARARNALDAARSMNDDDAALAAIKAAEGEMSFSPAAFVFGANARLALADADRRALDDELIRAAHLLSTSSAVELRRAAKILLKRTDPLAQALAGELLLAYGADPDAAAAFEQALARSPSFFDALRGRVRVSVRDGDYRQAVGRIEIALHRSPSDANLRLLYARALFASGAPKKAFEQFKGLALTTLAPMDQALSILVLQRADPAALELSAAALQKSPNIAVAQALFQTSHFEAAAASARQALISQSTDPRVPKLYLDAITAAGRESEGREVLSALRRSSDERSESLAPTDFEGARQRYLRDPFNGGSAARLGTALVSAGEADEAARVLREACFWAPESECNQRAHPPATDKASR